MFNLLKKVNLSQKKAELLLQTFKNVREDALNINDFHRGTLRLAVSNFYSKYKLPPLLKDFKDKYPEVDFYIETGYSRNVFQSVYNKNTHTGFLRGEYHWPGEKHLLFEEELCVFSMQDLDLQDLPQIPRINYKTDQLYKQMVDNWWTEHYKSPPYYSMSVDQGDTCKEMVKNGLGYAIMPSEFFSEHESVVRIPLFNNNNEPLTQKTWMCYYSESLKLQVVQTFINFVKSRQ